MSSSKLLYSLVIFISGQSLAQADSFDVYTYIAPELFTKSVLPSRIQFTLKNNDTSFCIITLYKSTAAKKDVLQDVTSQWNEQVVKRLSKANKKPLQVMADPDQFWDGWAHTVAIGNFYQNNKKCVVMLNSLRKGKQSAAVVFAMTDKSFKWSVETFSKNLHFKNQ